MGVQQNQKEYAETRKSMLQSLRKSRMNPYLNDLSSHKPCVKTLAPKSKIHEVLTSPRSTMRLPSLNVVGTKDLKWVDVDFKRGW